MKPDDLDRSMRDRLTADPLDPAMLERLADDVLDGAFLERLDESDLKPLKSIEWTPLEPLPPLDLPPLGPLDWEPLKPLDWAPMPLDWPPLEPLDAGQLGDDGLSGGRTGDRTGIADSQCRPNRGERTSSDVAGASACTPASEQGDDAGPTAPASRWLSRLTAPDAGDRAGGGDRRSAESVRAAVSLQVE